MSNDEKVSTIPRSRSELHVTPDGARMLLELLTQAAAKGPDAATLAVLYEDVFTLVDALPPKK
jgi:hypothetical protein